MKTFILWFAVFSSPVLAQSPNRPSLAPLAGVTQYGLDGKTFIGPTLGLRYFTREFASARLSVFGGVTLRPDGFSYYRSEPFIMENQAGPYRLQPPVYSGVVRESRFALGLGFIGFDWRTYLADGSVRPYLGLGAQLVSWSSSDRLTGTMTPDALAGLEVHLSDGFDAFGEGRYSYGMPTLFGSRISSLKSVTMLALGVTFAPRW